jgi:PKD repeat protein
MRLLVTFLFVAGFCCDAMGQLVCLNSQAADTTSYTNGMPNDSVYFVCAGEDAIVVVTPMSGESNSDFRWYSFSSVLNEWVFANEDVDAAFSTRDLPNGGFKVEVYDANDILTESYTCWICRIFFAPIVNSNTIQPGCTSVQLSGLYFNPQITSYFNPPPIITEAPLLISSDTEISICFDATHTFVSDLSFHLTGPSSCGSPHAVLSPAPFEIQEDALCNGGSDVSSLCFTNVSADNLDVCANAPFSLSGNYGSYGSAAIPIDWDIFIGCDANEEDWSVQVYDCVAGAVGELLGSSLVFSELDWLGNNVTVTYGTPQNFVSDIPDDVCAFDPMMQVDLLRVQESASIIPIQFTTEWIADPPFEIPNAVNNPSVFLNPAPTVDTYFTFKLNGPNIGNACDGNLVDVEFYDYIPPGQSEISIDDNILCPTDVPILLASNYTEGSWSGPGVIDPVSGLFSPQAAGTGVWEVAFNPASSCIEGDTETIIVASVADVQITPLGPLCSNEPTFQLEVNQTGGLWSGNGILNVSTGLFDPSLVGNGSASVSYSVGGECPSFDSMLIEVSEYTPLEIGSEDLILCLNDSPTQLTANLDGGVWSGIGLGNPSSHQFSPAIAGIGTWEITYTYDDICFDQATLNITVDDPQLSILPVAPVCFDASPVNLSASPAGGVWSGTGITNQLTGVFNPNSIGAEGSYTVYYQIDNACAPIDSLVIVIEGYPDVQLNIPDGLCAESSPVLLTANIPDGVWSGNAITGNISAFFDPSLGVFGENSLTYFVDGACDVQTSASVEIYEPPVIILSTDTTICFDGTAVLSADGGSGYQWQPATGLNQTTGSEVTAAPLQSTSYIVTGYSTEGCAGQAQTTVTVLDQPEVIVNGPFAICAADDIQLLASGLENYVWSGEGLSDYNVPDPQAAPQQTTSYTVSGLDSFGCYGENTITVEVISPSASFSADSYTGVSPFEPEINNTSAGDIFFWDFGNGDSTYTSDVSETVMPVFTGLQSYTVTLTAIIGDCLSTFSLVFNSYYDSEILLIPNIVSMDGNNKNDYFRMLTRNMVSMDVVIFDRWGKKVGGFVGPDSRWSPIEQGAGTYYYYYNALGLDGEIYQGSGEFLVVSSTD